MKAAKNFGDLPRRHVHIYSGPDERYPIVLESGGCYKFTQQMNPPFDECKLIIGCDSDASLSVEVNNLGQLPLQNEDVPVGFEYIPKEEIGKHLGFIHAVSQAVAYVKSAPLPTVSNAEIIIKNTSEQSLNILWLEFYFE